MLVKVGAVWNIDKHEASKYGAILVGTGVIVMVTSDGKYWFGTVNTGGTTFKVGQEFESKSLADIEVKQPDYWEKIRLAMIFDQLGIPSYGVSPFSKKDEDECSMCHRKKDRGQKCWWCGN